MEASQHTTNANRRAGGSALSATLRIGISFFLVLSLSLSLNSKGSVQMLVKKNRDQPRDELITNNWYYYYNKQISRLLPLLVWKQNINHGPLIKKQN